MYLFFQKCKIMNHRNVEKFCHSQYFHIRNDILHSEKSIIEISLYDCFLLRTFNIYLSLPSKLIRTFSLLLCCARMLFLDRLRDN